MSAYPAEQDMKDGRALRELRAVAAERDCHVTTVSGPDRWTVRVLDADGALVTRCGTSDLLSANADACRDALEAHS